MPAESFEAAFEPGSEGHPSLAGLAERPPGGLWDEKRGQCREEATHSAKHEDKHFYLAYILQENCHLSTEQSWTLGQSRHGSCLPHCPSTPPHSRVSPRLPATTLPQIQLQQTLMLSTAYTIGAETWNATLLPRQTLLGL